MTLAGWIVMITVVCSFTGLSAWCLYKVVTAPGTPEHFARIKLDSPDIHIE